ncbi:MAG: hypothetical protein KAS48_02875 [Gammaproteobacteria bacterium]|nr:hypothetical protein [Gammaproteobacteria bacterium]
MKSIIHLYDSPMNVQLSSSAVRALESLKQPLLADINLIFGCMIAKRVWFKEEESVSADTVEVADNLKVCFRTVRYVKTCRLSDIDNGAVSEDFPLAVDIKNFVPDWLKIDFRRGQWKGAFGFDRAIALENHQEDNQGESALSLSNAEVSI